MTTTATELAPDARWQRWVAVHPVLAPTVAGLIATQMATIIGYYLKGIGLPNVPWPLYNGALFAPSGKFGDPASFFVGQSIHMVDGAVFAILYVLVIRALIPLPDSRAGDVGKGLIYSTVLALISMGFLVPYVYVPKQGYGFFSFYTPDHWKLPVSILLFHLVYGYFLGTLLHVSNENRAIAGRP